ncbi:MAG: YigZ family protein [Prevotellaceae bacterium]|jgi:uncharacterized YigZ family protein|nr:YigZ family protein [Prevotellaceae bacterium]
MNDTYLTITTVSEGIYREKGSKFLAFAVPVCSVDEAKEQIENYRKQFYDARHVCYAYRVGEREIAFRSNDDGEPSGTAGKPILGQLLSNNLTNVLLVVVRYFGGVKLGTGGLTVAYKTAAADALANATIVEREIMLYYKISFKYEAMNSVMRAIKDESLRVIEQQFDTDCMLKIGVRLGRSEALLGKLNDIAEIEED